MEDSYQLGPIAVNKSFVRQPLFWPGVIVVILVIAAVVLVSSGKATIPTATKPAPTPSVKAQVFPLNQQLPAPVLYSVGTTIYLTRGQSEEKLYEVGTEVLSLAPSPNRAFLAATYKHAAGGANVSGYPYSSIIFWDMNTGRSLPIVAQERTTVRYPSWSEDSRYLAFWVNDGEESFLYDTTRRRAIYSVKREGSSAVSPIVFLPGGNGIAYIKDGTLYTAAIDGTRPIAIAQQAASTRTLGTTVASAPVPSPNGAYLSYYTIGGELAVVGTNTREVKTIGSGFISLGFLNNDELIYADATTDNPKTTPKLYRFMLADGTSREMNASEGFLSRGAWPQAAIMAPNNQFYLPSVYPNLGPQLVDTEGVVQNDCSTAEFAYMYDASGDDTQLPYARRALSPDGRYILGLSNNSQAVLDTTTCQPYIITQSRPTAMTWMQ